MAIKRLKLNSKDRKGEVKDRLEMIKKNREKNQGSGKFTKFKVSKKAFSALKKKKILKNIGIIALVIASIMFLVLVSGTIYAFSMLQKFNDELPSPDEPFKNPPVASVIYDRHTVNGQGGTQLYKIIGNYNSDPVDIKAIPDTVKWAFLAAEDIDFYNHNGFDSKGILRCGLNYVKDRGQSVCGGSTITQQLLKITALKDEKSKVTRKIKELLMSTKVEQSYDKDQILQMYLSVTPFGSNIVGIETASNYYFGVEPKDLKLEQAAILAAIIQNPSYLSPTKPIHGDTKISQEEVKDRQMYVLGQMEKYKDKINEQNKKNIGDKNAEDILTQKMIDDAREAKLEYKSPVATDIKAGHFVDYVQQALTTKNYKNGQEPFTLSDLQNNGYRIYTTLDYDQQKIAEDWVIRGANDTAYANVSNTALITIDPNNGQILVMAGSKSYFGEQEGCKSYTEGGIGQECKYDPQVNVLTSLNEPGSTAKVLAYTLAFEQGKLFGGSLLPDIPIDYGEIGYTPKNWDGGYKGLMTVRDALIQSRNITALQAIELVTVDEYIKKAQELGNTTFVRDQVGPSIVLGGASVRYVEHVNLFAAFANGGNYVPINPILKIEDRNGKVIYEATVQKTQVLSPQAVYMVNQILDNLQNVSGAAGVTLSSKTGTTESNTESLQVAWNSNQVTLAWAGNNNNEPLSPIYGYPIYVVQPWMAPYIGQISGTDYYRGKDATLARPGFVFIGGNNCDDKGMCLGIAPDWLIQGKTPPQEIRRAKVTVCKDQLGKVARPIDISTGNAIEKDFVQYTMHAKRWQGVLDKYIKDSTGLDNRIPTDPCTIDRSGGVTGPFFSVSAPAKNAVVDATVNVKGGIFTSAGTIQSATVLFDGQSIGTVTGNFAAIDQTFNTPVGLPDGIYDLSIEATDSNAVVNTFTVKVVLRSATTSGVTFTMPPATANSPLPLTISTAIPFVGPVTLYQIMNNGAPTVVGTMPANGTINIGPYTVQNANYQFYIEGTVGTGGVLKSDLSPTLTI